MPKMASIGVQEIALTAAGSYRIFVVASQMGAEIEVGNGPGAREVRALLRLKGLDPDLPLVVEQDTLSLRFWVSNVLPSIFHSKLYLDEMRRMMQVQQRITATEVQIMEQSMAARIAQAQQQVHYGPGLFGGILGGFGL
jgi:hypothetical protein